MCNLFAVRKPIDEIAAHYGVDVPSSIEVPEETVPQSAGLVVRRARDRRVIQSMSWGFPRLTREMRERGSSPTPVNLVANLASPMWQPVIEDRRYRAIIPFTHFAEPDGYPGSKTRTWYSVADEPLSGWAGFCQNTEVWGPVFAGMTTTSNEAVAELNPRMPVLLRPSEYDRWLDADTQGVIGFAYREYPASKLVREKTDDLWVRREVKPQPQMALDL